MRLTPPLSHTASPAPNRLATVRRYRRLMVGSVIAGLLLATAFRLLDHPLVGEEVYWLGILGILAIWWGTSVPLFDERDLAIERRASQLTLTLVAFVLIVGASAARVLPLVSDVSVPSWVTGALYAYVGVFVVFGVAYAWFRYR